MSRLLLKGCPRCHGDLRLVRDLGDRYISCFQCGYAKPVPVEVAPARVA